MRQSVTASASQARRVRGAGGRLHRAMAGLLATVLVTGLFGGVLGGVFATTASAATTPACTTTHTSTTCTATLTVSPPAALGVAHNPPNRLAAYHGNPTTFRPTTPLGTTTATVTPKGGISGVTLPTVFYHEGPSTVNTHTTETIVVSQPTAGSASGSVNATGAVTLTATVQILVTVRSPAIQVCKTKPTVVLQSTSPYTPTSRSVALADTTFTVPNFTTSGTGSDCGLAATQLNQRFAGPSGNDFSLGLTGALPLPPKPTISTTTTVTSPAGPSVAGQSVTVKATVNSGTPGTLGATGATVTFFDGTTQIGAPQPVVTASASVTTTTLPVGTNQVTAVYSGNGVYIASTSSAVTFTVQPVPTVSLSFPATATGNSTTLVTGSMTITNPGASRTWPQLALELKLSGLRNTSHRRVKVQYEDGSGTWCTLPGYTGNSNTIRGFFAGLGSSCTATYPTSFSMTAGQPITVPLRLGYPKTPSNPTLGAYGVQTITATLSTGTLVKIVTPTTPTTFTIGVTAVAPLSGTLAPVGTAKVNVNPVPKLAATITDQATTRPATSTVRQTFSVPLASGLAPTTGSNSSLPAPSGTVTYAVDGTAVATSTLPVVAGGSTTTPLVLFNTAALSLGVHQLVATYNGDHVYNPVSLTETFTVIAAPSGTSFSCIVAGLDVASPLPAYVTATSTPPSSVLSTATTTVPVHGIKETITLDPAELAKAYNTDQTAATLGFSGGQSIKAKPITFTGTTGTPPQITGTWTETTPTGTLTVPVEVPKGTAPGTALAVGAQSAAFSLETASLPKVLGCSAVSAAAPVASVTVGGTTLVANPPGPVAVGIPVTLTSTVYPTPAAGASGGTVQFYDGATPIGARQSVAGGTVSVTVSSLAKGTHTLTASWTGTSTSGIGYNVSNAVSLTVGTQAPAVTTQPNSQAVNVGQPASFSAAASGTAPSVQWQVSTNGGRNWSTVPGATSGTLSFSALGTDSGNQYRAVFTNAAGSATSNAATLTVTTAGYWLMAKTGSVYSYGTAPFYGSMGGQTLNKPIVGTASTPGDGGYWLVASDGGIFSFGNAAFYGSMGGKPLNQPIVGIAATPDGKGYWEVASDGGIFAFGDAAFYGSMGGKALNQPIVGIAATPDGKGYWEVASDGGIFAFGDAAFYGSTGSLTLNKPIVGMASTSNGGGYWLVAADGGVFSFGNAGFHGTVAGTTSASIVSIVPTTDGGGYWETASSGQVFQFGDATSAGTALTQTATIVAMSD
jgi:hypothetical protein